MNVQFTKTDLYNVLYDKDFTPEKLIELLSVDLSTIYQSSAGVWEGYTIGEHTIMVMKQFERYFAQRKLPANLDNGLFRFILALHDIGKSEAIVRGNKNDQHIYTITIMKYIFDQVDLSNKDKKIATEIVAQDSLGQYIRGNVSVAEASETIKQSAKFANLNPRDFFELLTIFYKCDAGSYTEDAGGFKSLDHLFVFDRDTPSLTFAQDILLKVQKLKEGINSK